MSEQAGLQWQVLLNTWQWFEIMGILGSLRCVPVAYMTSGPSTISNFKRTRNYVILDTTCLTTTFNKTIGS